MLLQLCKCHKCKVLSQWNFTFVHCANRRYILSLVYGAQRNEMKWNKEQSHRCILNTLVAATATTITTKALRTAAQNTFSATTSTTTTTVSTATIPFNFFFFFFFIVFKLQLTSIDVFSSYSRLPACFVSPLPYSLAYSLSLLFLSAILLWWQHRI